MEENERKPIFTNTLQTSREMYLELFRAMRKKVSIMICVIGACFLVYGCYQLVRLIRSFTYYGESFVSEPAFWMLLGCAVLWVILIARVLLTPRRVVKRQMRMNLESYGTEQVEIETDFFDDTVELHNRTSKGEHRFVYPAFRKVTETKNLFLLWTGQKQIVVLYKLGFDGTDIVGFRAFIDEKCPNAKRKWRKAD